MLVDPDQIECVFRKVIAARKRMSEMMLGGTPNVVNPMDFAAVVADMYGLKIEMYEVTSTGGELVAGNVERYSDGRAVILVKSQQSDAMIRLVAVKELCHLMNDEEDDWSNQALNTIKEMKVEFDLAKANGEGVPNPSRTQVSEIMAFIAALAILYSCEFHENDRAKLEKGETSYAKIALEHEIPAWAVESAHAHRELYEIYHEIVRAD